MVSNTRQTRIIRKNKRRPNKENLKKYMKRIQENAKILRELEKMEKDSE